MLRIDIEDCPAEIKEKLVAEGFSLRKWGTFIIDLEKPEEELWNAIKKEARKNIKRTQNEGCHIELCKNDYDFKGYYQMFKQSRKSLKFTTPPYHVMRRQWHILHPNNFEIFLVKDRAGELLAGMGVVFTKDYMIEVAAGRQREKHSSQLYPNDLLKWEIIKWGHEQKIKYYDLAGINPAPSPESKEGNIKRFKEKWGGQYHDWYFFEKHNPRTLLQKIFYKIEKKFRKQHETL
jgi:lipid II:glycine glycyltransferase (peptidoglycan interpeptide bridge formation enzyme)